MQLQDIAKVLGLQDVEIKKVNIVTDEEGGAKEAEIWLEPIEAKQTCPCCGSS